MILDAWASEAHYLAHVLPIWVAMPRERRGHLYVNPGLERQAAIGGCDGDQIKTGMPPASDNLLMVAAYTDMLTTGMRQVVLVEHGAGQEYGDENPSYSGGRDRDTVELFIVPNEIVAARNRKMYPDTPNAVVGCPKLDRWLRRGPKRRPAEPVVAISFHWHCQLAPESLGAFEHYSSGLLQLAERFKLLGHTHPKAQARIVPYYEQYDIEWVADFDDIMLRADVYVCDNSSTLYEFAALDRPVVVMNAPWYRRDIDFWPRFWAHADVGVQVDDPNELVSAIAVAAADALPWPEQRHRAVDAVYAVRDGSSSNLAAKAICDHLNFRLPTPRRPAVSNNWIDDPYAPTYPTAMGDARPVFPQARMERLGAIPAEIHASMIEWDQMTEAEQAEAVAAMAVLSDTELRAQIEADRMVPLGTVEEILSWVGNDATRAQSALLQEQQASRPRKSLIKSLETVE